MPDGSGDAAILGLPTHLRRVPGYVSREDDRWRAEWFQWRDALLDYREDVHLAAATDPGFRDNERFLCADDPKYWAAVWGWVFEPRARNNQRKHVPFTLFAFQCHFIDWLVTLADNPEQADGLADKSRGIGLSWAVVLFAVWGWDFHDITTLLLSRTQSDVDKPNSMNTLFGKAVYLIDNTPDWLLPEGFNRDRDRTQMNIANPWSKAQIFGDSTTAEAGRGDRATIAFVDEAPFIAQLKDVWSTLGGTTDHRVGLGSQSIKYGMTWTHMLRGHREHNPTGVFTLDFWLNPYQDEAWREREFARREADNDLPGYYAEIERNPWRGRTNIIYPEARTVVFDGPPYDPALPILVSIDPGVVDDTAIIVGQPLDGDARHGQINWLECYENNNKPGEYYAHLLTGIPAEPGDLAYGYDFSGRRTEEFMAWALSWPWTHDRVKIVMDPAGKQKDSGNLSFQLRIIQESKRLRKRWLEQQIAAGRNERDLPALRALTPLCEDIVPLNSHQARHQAARDLLMRSTWYDAPGPRRIAAALAMYRNQELTARATREPGPIHDDDCSHVATSFEFAGCYASGGYFGIKKRELSPPTTWDRDLAPGLILGVA